MIVDRCHRKFGLICDSKSESKKKRFLTNVSKLFQFGIFGSSAKKKQERVLK